MRILFLGIVCFLINGNLYADDGPQTTHPEDRDIVGVNGSTICFNNDGIVEFTDECNGSAVDEGYVALSSLQWRGGGLSGINGCGTSAVNPVSSATCPFTQTNFAACENDEHVLVQTTHSGHYFTIEPRLDCLAIDIFGLRPCLKSDSFDPVTGCTRTDNPPEISIGNGYFHLDDVGVPPDSHCADSSHYGRMSVHTQFNRLYICTMDGWTSTDLNLP
jgi:hypothetical protein